jgi:transposase
MQERSDRSPIVNIMELAHEIIDTCPECTGRASEIIVWAEQIRERRPSREELAALIDVTCPGALTETQRANLIEGLRALVRFAE